MRRVVVQQTVSHLLEYKIHNSISQKGMPKQMNTTPINIMNFTNNANNLQNVQ